MHYIGIEIGGTNITGGVVTSEGTVVVRQKRLTPITEGGPRILEEAILVAKLLIKESGSSYKIQGIGIGAGGQINKEGVVYSATDVIPRWKGVRITEGFNKALGLAAAADNDVNVVALAETRFGAARQISNGTVIFLGLGTGVGGAILIDGVILRGALGSGGELGHLLINMDANSRRDLGGAPGTLEAYCSGPGMVQTWRELTGNADPNIDGYDVARDAQTNPNGAGAIAIRKTGEYLGFGLASLGNVLFPRLIVIGGGLSELGDVLLEPARRVLKERALPEPGSCPVVTAELGVDAGIVGAACLAMTNSSKLALVS